MKKLLLATLTLAITSCTLFIDDDKLLLEQNPYPTYTGDGYDAPVTEKLENVDVTYQLHGSTMTLNADDKLSNYINRAEEVEGVKYIYFDKSVPKELLPEIGQVVVSGNTDLFEYGMCDLVFYVGEENGEVLMKSVLTDYTDAYKEFSLNMHPNIKDVFAAYDIYDKDGNWLGEVNGEDNASSPAKVRKEKSNLDEVKEEFEKEEADFKEVYDLDFGMIALGKTILDFLKKMPKKEDSWMPSDAVDVDFDFGGGIKFGDLDVESNLNPFGGGPMYLQISKNWSLFRVFLDFQAGIKLPQTEWIDLASKKFKTIERFKFGTITPEIRGYLGIDMNAYVHILPVFTAYGDGVLYTIFDNRPNGYKPGKKIISKAIEAKFELKYLELEGKLELPQLKIEAGAGVCNGDVTLTIEVIAKPVFQLEVDKLKEVFLHTELKLGVGGMIRAKGAIMSKILNAITSKLPCLDKIWSTLSKFEADYINSGTLEDWILFEKAIKDGTIAKDGTVKMNSEIDKSIPNERFLTMWNEYKREVNTEQFFNSKKDKKGRDKAKINEANKKKKDKIEEDPDHVMHEHNKDEPFEWEIGPWWPGSFFESTWYSSPRYINGSLKVQTKWDKSTNKVSFIPEFQLETPGFGSLTGDYDVYFEIRAGDTPVYYERADYPKKVTKDTPKGTRFVGQEIFNLHEDQPYTCFPVFVGSTKHYERHKLFSATTPALAIVSQEPEVVSHEYKDGKFKCTFKIIVDAVGVSYIQDLGFIDKNDNTDKNKHYARFSDVISSNEDHSGSATYEFTITLTTTDIIANLSLQPFVDLIGAPNQSGGNQSVDSDYTRTYNIWNRTIDFSQWYNGSSAGNSSANEYTLTLDSIELLPEEDATDGEDSDE